MTCKQIIYHSSSNLSSSSFLTYSIFLSLPFLLQLLLLVSLPFLLTLLLSLFTHHRTRPFEFETIFSHIFPFLPLHIEWKRQQKTGTIQYLTEIVSSTSITSYLLVSYQSVYSMKKNWVEVFCQ